MLSIRSKVPQVSIVVFMLIFALASARPAVAADFADAPAAVTTCDTYGDAGLVGYTVKQGDTLYAIGQACGVNWLAIANLNGIVAPYLIYPGQHLDMPAIGGPDGSGGLRTYTVQPGDWLWKIGRALGINPLEIARVNGLTAPYVIYPGQVLVLP